MSMWTYIKRGFGYGFGGRLGWEAGGLVWGWIMKIVGLIMLAVGATWGLPMIGDSVGTYNQVKQKYEQQARQVKAEKQEAGHARRD